MISFCTSLQLLDEWNSAGKVWVMHLYSVILVVPWCFLFQRNPVKKVKNQTMWAEPKQPEFQVPVAMHSKTNSVWWLGCWVVKPYHSMSSWKTLSCLMLFECIYLENSTTLFSRDFMGPISLSQWRCHSRTIPVVKSWTPSSISNRSIVVLCIFFNIHT